MDPTLLRRTAEIAADYLASLPERPVRAEASLAELRSALRVRLDDAPQPALQVIEELVAAADPGLVGSQSPRYFGFVIGGSLDAAIAADWLTSVWDQNGGGYPVGPSASVAEEVACEWLLDILGLPADAGVGLTTGCQMAHFTCLAAARHRVLADAGWDVEADGLFGAPPVRVLVGAKAHTTVFAALRELGRRGVAELVERCCACARLMAAELACDPRVTVLNEVVLNQVLVRFAAGGANVTDEVIDAVQREGTCWMSGTEWEGQRAMRISVCNWRTTEDDVRRSAAAILEQAGV